MVEWFHVPGHIAALSIPIVLIGLSFLGMLAYAVSRGIRSYHRDGLDYPPLVDKRPLPFWADYTGDDSEGPGAGATAAHREGGLS